MQEEREELWKTVMAFHSHQKSDMDPIYHRLESLEKRTSDIEKHLQSRGPDTSRGIPANDRLEDLERRACELDKQVKRQHTHFLHGPHQVIKNLPSDTKRMKLLKVRCCIIAQNSARENP